LLALVWSFEYADSVKKGAHLGPSNEGERTRETRAAHPSHSPVAHLPSLCSRGGSVKAAWCGVRVKVTSGRNLVLFLHHNYESLRNSRVWELESHALSCWQRRLRKLHAPTSLHPPVHSHFLHCQHHNLHYTQERKHQEDRRKCKGMISSSSEGRLSGN
jgi:hypothetical protein